MASLALGTVQFGLSYGVANLSGQTSLEQATAILALASHNGIDTLDTAIAYGDSERRLGEIGVQAWQVITKLPPLPGDVTDVRQWVHRSVAGSLERMHIPRLRGLLLHRARDLLGANGAVLANALYELRAAGLVGKVGVSIYDPEDLEALSEFGPFDLVQAPFNIVDRRLATSGWLARMHAEGTEVHVRSVFLQGLLLMKPEERPARFAPFQALWRDWQGWLEETGLTALQACLGFALSQPEISRAVVGVDSEAHLREILAGTNIGEVRPPPALISNDPELINPLSWITK